MSLQGRAEPGGAGAAAASRQSRLRSGPGGNGIPVPQREWDPGHSGNGISVRARRAGLGRAVASSGAMGTGGFGSCKRVPQNRPGLRTRYWAFDCPGTFGASGGPRPGAGEAPPGGGSRGEGRPGAVRGVGPGRESGMRLRDASGKGFKSEIWDFYKIYFGFFSFFSPSMSCPAPAWGLGGSADSATSGTPTRRRAGGGARAVRGGAPVIHKQWEAGPVLCGRGLA